MLLDRVSFGIWKVHLFIEENAFVFVCSLYLTGNNRQNFQYTYIDQSQDSEIMEIILISSILLQYQDAPPQIAKGSRILPSSMNASDASITWPKYFEFLTRAGQGPSKFFREDR